MAPEDYDIPPTKPLPKNLPPVTPPELEDEEAILAFTHQKRKYIVNEMLKAGVPEDPQETKVILGALKDMDASALGRKRIKVEEQANNNQEQAAGLIAQLLQRTIVGTPYQAPQGVDREVPTLGKDIPDPVLVEGEVAIMAPQQSYESFVLGADSPAPDMGELPNEP